MNVVADLEAFIEEGGKLQKFPIQPQERHTNEECTI